MKQDKRHLRETQQKIHKTKKFHVKQDKKHSHETQQK